MELRITRREFHRTALAAGTGFLVLPNLAASVSEKSPFLHPGILHSAVDLERMRDAVRVGRKPITEGFEKLREHPLSNRDYAHHDFNNEIGRNPNVNFQEFDSDAGAAYQCALMAAITGDHSFAQTARTIVMGWSASLQRVSGADAVLMASLGPFKLVNAAEILRYVGELNAQENADCAAMLRGAILPTIVDFAPFANGNWDTAAVKTMLAIAVFCDNQALFERALSYYLHGDGDGRLSHYIYESGQCQESGRDQQHTQLGLGHLGDACQIAWNQGWDLFGAFNNRLLKGFEYMAAYNLGDQVAFCPDVDRTGKYHHPVISQRSTLRPIYEQILAHYHVRRGLSAPNVMKAVEKIRPEGAAPGADHTGFGTLLYARTPDDPDTVPRPNPPVALHAIFKDGSITLSWLKPRATPEAILERNGLDARADAQIDSYQDKRVEIGKNYVYRISSPTKYSFTSAPLSIMAGLPSGWTSAAIENPAIGDAQFDGKVLTLTAAGKGLMRPSDEGQCVALPSSASRIEARFIPQVASQFAQFGLTRRSGSGGLDPAIALLVVSGGGDRERPGWRIRLVVRDVSGDVSTLSDSPLSAPVVTYGRLVKPIWLRLQMQDSVVETSFSIDGETWAQVVHCPDFEKSRFAVIVSSGIAAVSTSVRFEISLY